LIDRCQYKEVSTDFMFWHFVYLKLLGY
jgi:hypothetical protein